MSERRLYSRVIFSGDCSLTEEIDGKVKTSQTTVLDISLTGALVGRPSNWQDQPGALLNLNLTLPGSAITLEINSVVCHQEESFLGLKFLTLSLDSLTHLKRLIQLNLADEELLHREMSQLINPSEQ